MVNFGDHDVIDLLTELVSIASVNPQLSSEGTGETAIAQFLVDWSRDNDLTTQLLDHGDDRPSVLLRSGAPKPDAPKLLLCGHLDTVGLGAMAQPLTPRIVGDRLYGRGSYDMKAGLAAAVIACREAARQGWDVEVIVAAVADEEHASLGVQRVLSEVTADAAIVIEPTDMVIGTAHKGFVWSEITVHGRAAHGSRPELGVDAIAKTAGVLKGLEVYNSRLARAPHELLGPGTVHASVISGGQEPSTIPGQCAVTIERRTLPAEGLADVESEVAQLLRACTEADPEFAAEAVTRMHRQGMETAADHPIVAALRQAHWEVRSGPSQVAGLSYWADSAFLAAAGIPTVLFGPGGEGAHADVEWASISDTADCARILAEVAHAMSRD